ncbi:restriction endonuclease [Dysgonomonas sp.]
MATRSINNSDSMIQVNSNSKSEVKKITLEERELLKDFLIHTTPHQFEHIVKDLLIAMGFKSVEVTSRTNDKGVDIIGTNQNGIEVIQVKRNTSSKIARPVLDGLRGCLHRFNALQGTVITLSDFTKGARDAKIEKGAAPLNLINGEELINLLIQYEVGTIKNELVYYTVNKNYFKE